MVLTTMGKGTWSATSAQDSLFRGTYHRGPASCPRFINGCAEATRKHMSPELWFGALPGRGAKVGFDAAVQAHRRRQGKAPLPPLIANAV